MKMWKLSHTPMWLWGERLCLIIWHVVMPPIARGQTGTCQSLPVSTVPNTGRNLSNSKPNYRGLDEEYLATRSRHLSRSLAIMWAPCQLTPISSRFYLNVLSHGFFGFSFFLLPSFYTQYGQFFLFLQSDNMVSYFSSPRCDNVLESLHACPPHHLFICRMIAPWYVIDCA